MKKLILVATFLLGFVFVGLSQTEKVEWVGTAEMIDENTYKVTLTAEVEEGWFIYSQHLQDGGPIPTSIELEGENFVAEGDIEETGEITKEVYDDVFEIDIKKFGERAVFTQIVKTNGSQPEINALVNFMTCNDERCNPPRNVTVYVAL